MAAALFSIQGSKDIFYRFNQCEGCQQPLTERVKTACNHFFHPDCLIPWLENKSTCPTCRQDVQKLTLPQPGELLPVTNPEDRTECSVCQEVLNAESVNQVFADVFCRTASGKNYHPACFQSAFGTPPSSSQTYKEIGADLLLKEQLERIFWMKVAAAVVVLACLAGIISAVGFAAVLDFVLEVLEFLVTSLFFFVIFVSISYLCGNT
jgi:hypothetical protein